MDPLRAQQTRVFGSASQYSGDGLAPRYRFRSRTLSRPYALLCRLYAVRVIAGVSAGGSF